MSERLPRTRRGDALALVLAVLGLVGPSLYWMVYVVPEYSVRHSSRTPTDGNPAAALIALAVLVASVGNGVLTLSAILVSFGTTGQWTSRLTAALVLLLVTVAAFVVAFVLV